MTNLYFVDDEENIYSFKGISGDGIFHVTNIVTGYYNFVDFDKLEMVESDVLIKGLIKKIKETTKKGNKIGIHTFLQG